MHDFSEGKTVSNVDLPNHQVCAAPYVSCISLCTHCNISKLYICIPYSPELKVRHKELTCTLWNINTAKKGESHLYSLTIM